MITKKAVTLQSGSSRRWQGQIGLCRRPTGGDPAMLTAAYRASPMFRIYTALCNSASHVTTVHRQDVSLVCSQASAFSVIFAGEHNADQV